ncbi:MAG: peptidyl-prolyl cis-trans isomerase, partial [Oscillospiraceae bacterium]|nr:peptidyl-prolyl cis-trans isomerase [Oscillospiraceae bacterium]
VKENLDARIAAVKAQAASYNVSYSAYLQSVFGPYMSTGVYEKMVQRTLLANLAYTDKGTELSESYTEADLTAYYDKDDNADTLDTFTYSYLYFTPADVETKDADGNDIDQETIDTKKELALAEAKSNADEALASLKGGSSISSLVSKYKLDDKNYADHTASVGSGRINSTFQEKLLELKDGESALVENGTSGYYVVTFHGRERVEDPTKDVRHILALAETTTDENGSVVEPTQEAWDAAKEKIEAIQAEWEAGDKTEDSFAALANEKSDDGDGTSGGLYTKIDVGDIYVPEFLEWIFADGRNVGDTGIVQHSAADSDSNKYWGYHFMYLVGDNEPLWMRSARNALTSEALTSWQEGLNSSCATNLADGANYLGK